ncbi:hypothetical protein ACVRZG_04570 [Streptococcus hyovaginalis]
MPMLEALTIQGYYQNQDEKNVLVFLDTHFNHLFHITIQQSRSISDGNEQHDAQSLTFDFKRDTSQDLTLILSNPENTITFPQDYDEKASFLLSLARKLTLFYHEQIAHLDYYPFQVKSYSPSGDLVYDNYGFDGSFFSFHTDKDQKLEPWIQEQLKAASNHRLTMSVPAASFDQILMQDYQGLYAKDGTFHGVLSQIVDLKPLLETYLKESGQALVGWSDATSGASISNGDFDDF